MQAVGLNPTINPLMKFKTKRERSEKKITSCNLTFGGKSIIPQE